MKWLDITDLYALLAPLLNTGWIEVASATPRLADQVADELAVVRWRQA